MMKRLTAKATKSTNRFESLSLLSSQNIGCFVLLSSLQTICVSCGPSDKFANQTSWIDCGDIGKGDGRHCATARARCGAKSTRHKNNVRTVRDSKL
jgi:hypothetical protein